MTSQVLKNKAYFTTAEAYELGVSPRMLSFYVQKGEIERMARGVYRHSDYTPSDKNIHWEDLAVASRNIRGGVICLVSALNYYDLTDELMREFWIACPNNISSSKFPMTRVIRMRNIELGRTHAKIGGLDVMIFNRERTVVDAFRFLSIETAVKSLILYMSSKTKPNLKLLTSYAKKLRVDLSKYLLAITV